MKIINKKQEQKYFRDIEQGTVFQLKNKFFLKTERIETDDFSCNAVNLENGITMAFCEVTTVTPLDCELVIK